MNRVGSDSKSNGENSLADKVNNMEITLKRMSETLANLSKSQSQSGPSSNFNHGGAKGFGRGNFHNVVNENFQSNWGRTSTYINYLHNIIQVQTLIQIKIRDFEDIPACLDSRCILSVGPKSLEKYMLKAFPITSPVVFVTPTGQRVNPVS